MDFFQPIYKIILPKLSIDKARNIIAKYPFPDSLDKKDYRVKEKGFLKSLYTAWTLKRACLVLADNAALQDLPIGTAKEKFLFKSWEYSVFENNDGMITKIPANTFPEPQTEKYQKNAEKYWNTTKKYFGNRLLNAKFIFKQNDTQIIQESVQGELSSAILFSLKDIWKDPNLQEELNIILKAAQKMLKEEHLMPNLKPWYFITQGKIRLYDCVLTHDGHIKVAGVSPGYLCEYRLFPAFTRFELFYKNFRIKWTLCAINKKLF